MTGKIILGAIVTIAFLAGTITTGTGVFAADHGDNPNGQPFKDIWIVIGNLQDQITDIELIPGPQGNDGQDGSSCTIDETIVSCTDGTSSDVQGPTGDQGPDGDAGISLPHTYRIFASATGSANLGCNPGDTILGGGFVGVSSGVNEARLIGGDAEHPTLWAVSPVNLDDDYNISVFCADTEEPPHVP
jgi:hypothetical protein